MPEEMDLPRNEGGARVAPPGDPDITRDSGGVLIAEERSDS